MENFQRQAIPQRVIPVRLDPVANHPQRFVLASSASLTLLVAEFVERYERALARTVVAGSVLVKRNVLESPRLLARHLPLCPDPHNHAELPEDDIDCVAHALDYDTSFYHCASFVLRVRARPGLITGELYITAAPKAWGMVVMPFKETGYMLGIGSWFDSSYASRHPHKPNKEEETKAKKVGEGILHIVQAAMEEAALPLLDASAKARIQQERPNPLPGHETSPAQTSTPENPPSSSLEIPLAAVQPIATPIKRRTAEEQPCPEN